MNIKRKRRKEKGDPPERYIKDKSTHGKRKGEDIKKPVRPNVLMDVLELRNRGKTKKEIHDFGCNKYFFRDNNPWGDRYFKHIEENDL